MERLIKVTGKGVMKFRPDQICLHIQINGLKRTYDKAVKEAADQLGEITKVIVGTGVKESDVKSVDFNVKTDYEDFYEDGKHYREFRGYKFHHSLKVVFPLDNELLGKVIYAVSHCEIVPEFYIDYEVKDVENAKNKLLAMSVSDAKEKAVILADAAGVKLGKIVNIDYSWSELEFTSSNDYRMCMMESKEASPAGTYNVNINPDDIDVDDTVTVLWEIV